jgi:transcriptional regulator with XRE-family HTH domain
VPSCDPERLDAADEWLVAVGVAIRTARRAASLSQAALGERAGLHRTYINEVENGHRNLTLVSLRRIADATNRTPAQLLKEAESLRRGER